MSSNQSNRATNRSPMRIAASRRDTMRVKNERRNQNINAMNKSGASSATSAVHRLDTIVSSDSYSMGSTSLSVEMRHLEEMGSPRSALLGAADDWYDSGGNTNDRNNTDERQDERSNSRIRAGRSQREVTPPPPPPPPPPPQVPPPTQQAHSNYHRLDDNDNRSVASRQSYHSKMFSQSQQQRHQESLHQPVNHKQALISLLEQLKASETSHTALQKRYQTEKSHLLQTISKQEEHMNAVYKQLEVTKHELEKSQGGTVDKVSLVKILGQLSNFASGCHHYAKQSNSASVKKMSDALRIQVGEWMKFHDIDLASSSDQEESSMEVIQSLQMEIEMLRAENALLKKRTKANDACPPTTLGGGSGSSDADSVVESKAEGPVRSKQVKVPVDADDVSQMSGMTSMSSNTKMSALVGFQADFDASRKARVPLAPTPIPHPPSTLPKRSETRIPPPRLTANPSAIPPRRAGRKVHIHATPQILANDEGSAAHVASCSPRSIMKKSTYSKDRGHTSRQGPSGRRLQLHLSQESSENVNRSNVITHSFTKSDSPFGNASFVNDEFGDDYSEV